MNKVFISIIVVITAGIIVYSANLSDNELAIGGFYLSFFGLIISIGGTILSGLSFVNAKAAKNAAIEARKQISKGMQNIELTKLYKLGEEVREKAQKLRDKCCEDHEEILNEIERFAYKAEDMSLLISGTSFSTYPNLIRTKVNEYRREVEKPGAHDYRNSHVNFIKHYITKILKIVNKQMDDNIK